MNYIEEKSFEKYLEKVCFEANPTVLDDDMPDFFDDWLGIQNGEDYIRLADEYATEVDRRARESHGEMVAEYLRDWDVHAMDDREFRALVRHYIKNNLTPNQ